MVNQMLLWCLQMLILVFVALATTTGAAEAPTGLIADHPPVRLQYRPPNSDKHAVQGAELHYFFLRGLGEIPRLLLELTETPYDSVMYFSREAKEYKDMAPFGQMPLYTDKEVGTWVAQQGSIVRYIARRAGLTGKNTTDEATIDMLFELSKDIWGKKEMVHEGAKSQTVDAKKLAMYLDAAQKYLGDKPFLLYDVATYADVALFHVLNSLEEIAAPIPSFLATAGYTKLQRFVERFRALPPIQRYLASPRRVPLTEKEMGKGSSSYLFMEPVSAAALASVDTRKPEL